MPRQGKYPDEVRERAVRMVLDHEGEYGSQWEAICSVADKLGPKAETVRLWVRQAERDSGRRQGPTSDELAELRRLKRENAELRRANDRSTMPRQPDRGPHSSGIPVVNRPSTRRSSSSSEPARR